MFSKTSSRLRNNVEECGKFRKATNDTIIWRMRFVTLDNKGYKHTPRICNNSCFSTTKMVTRMRLNITFYAYRLSSPETIA